jgi:hypothetical protein
VNRYTFVIHVYPGGATMVKNLSTQEQVGVADLAAVGPQIQRWLAGLPGPSIQRLADRRVADGLATDAPTQTADARASSP